MVPITNMVTKYYCRHTEDNLDDIVVSNNSLRVLKYRS